MQGASRLAELTTPLKIEVTDATPEAEELLRSAGHTVKKVFFNRVTLRAHLHPEMFDFAPRSPGIPPPKLRSKYAHLEGELRELVARVNASPRKDV